MQSIDAQRPTPVTTEEVDDQIFRTHFDNLPGPAYIWRRDGNDFRLIAYNRAGARMGPSSMESFIGTAASQIYAGRPDILADLQSCADERVVLRRESDFEFRDGTVHTLAVTCVPLSRDTVVGHVDDVTQQRAATRALARDVSDRVELERKLTVIGERERNEIGREIHDGLAQMLTGVKLMMEHLEKRLREEGSVYAHEASVATDLINGTIAQARELVRGLSPIPQGTTLFQGLELLASHAAKYLGVSCRTNLTGDPTGLNEVAIAHVYRIAQEAITNAVRHGKAAEIQLECRITNDKLALTIADAGSGYVEPSPATEGLGLKIMRYRARSLGGDVSIERRPEGGTLVTCVWLLRSLRD